MISDLFSFDLLSSASFDSLLMSGDDIGMESCVDVLIREKKGYVGRRKKEKKRTYLKNSPPPLSLLARTENLPSHSLGFGTMSTSGHRSNGRLRHSLSLLRPGFGSHQSFVVMIE
ncbi:hypothetical protein DVH24_033854 [Malus domestica]|uniref:Uncharacterized protein n=1 Tax=Malus domestica TaxID=3750 RepID=A0A498KPX1_MALDO|nr:hypothetical protein DVH24_033854 [Malus domestica]